MGACYDVRLQMQFSVPDAKEKVVATMQEYIKKETSVDFSLDKYAAEGVTTDSLEERFVSEDGRNVIHESHRKTMALNTVVHSMLVTDGNES